LQSRSKASPSAVLAVLDAAAQAHDLAVAADDKKAADTARAAMTEAHGSLLKQLRGKGPAPDWDRFPRGRDVFTQRDPWERVR
jgi:hypothetical protein